MGQLLDLVTPLHQRTPRDYLARMNDEKVECMVRAKEYGPDYWDGNRRYGYGGYRYIPGYWTTVAEGLIKRYELCNSSSLLDVGCGKGYLLYELKKILPGLTVAGFDISRHGLAEASPEIRSSIFFHSVKDPFPYDEQTFDLVISLGCLHNLRLPELQSALSEIQRVGKNGYVVVESYRNEQEQFNLQCWALTAESFLDPDEWLWIYQNCGYLGDYEFIYFE